ncbi:hypothetical protein D3C75_1165610 [compost metagenome]
MRSIAGSNPAITPNGMATTSAIKVATTTNAKVPMVSGHKPIKAQNSIPINVAVAKRGPARRQPSSAISTATT